jgi:hypothetical protein
MNAGAGVTSFTVLHDWYAALTEFRSDAQDALTSLSLALQHADAWLDEQQQHWRRQIRACEEAVTQAKTELRTRQIPDAFGHPVDCTVQEKNLRLAKARLEEAEERLAAVRRWMLRLPREVCDTYTGPAGHLASFLDGELPSGLALLTRQLNALEQYANLRADTVPASAAPTVAAKPEKEKS